MTSCLSCSNHVGTSCTDVHYLDPWSAADVVTISWTRGSTRQTHSADYVAPAPAKSAIASSSSSSTTTTTTGDSTPAVYALGTQPLDLSPSRPILPCAHAARSTALTLPVMKNHAVQGARPSDLGQHQLQRRGDLDGPLQCFLLNVLAVYRSPHRQHAIITVTPSYAMDGNVFPLVLADDQDTIIAGVRDINDSET